MYGRVFCDNKYNNIVHVKPYAECMEFEDTTHGILNFKVQTTLICITTLIHKNENTIQLGMKIR